MKKRLLILFFLACASLFSYGQDVKKSQPDSLIKVIPEGRHFLFTIDGKLQSPEDIQDRLLRYPPSAIEVKAVKRNIPWSFAFLGSSAVTSTAAGFAFYNNNKPPVATAVFVNGKPGFSYTYPNNNKTGAYILTGAAIGFLTAAITTWINTARHGKRALYLYNRQFE